MQTRNTSAPRREIAFTVEPQSLVRRTILVCLAIEVSLVLLDAFCEYGKLLPHKSLRRLFNLAREGGLGTWFASIQAVVVSAVLWTIRSRLKVQPAALSRSWGFLAAFFLYVAIDDSSKVHERVGTAFEDLSDHGWPFDLFPSYAWQLVFAPLFGAGAVVILWVLWRWLSSRDARLFVGLGLCCYVSAVGLDFLEGIEGLHASIASALSAKAYTVRHFSKVVEEFVEMFGTTMFLAGFLAHLLAITDTVPVVPKNSKPRLFTAGER